MGHVTMSKESKQNNTELGYRDIVEHCWCCLLSGIWVLSLQIGDLRQHTVHPPLGTDRVHLFALGPFEH